MQKKGTKKRKETVIRHQECWESLGISKKTYINLRKEVGIFAETRKGLNMTQFLLLQNHHKVKQRQNLTNKTIKTKVDIEDKKFNSFGDLKIDELDSQVVVHLKNDYNKNRKYIAHFQSIIDVDVAMGQIPSKDVVNGISTYEKLNLHILKDIERESGRTDKIEDLITQKMANYE